MLTVLSSTDDEAYECSVLISPAQPVDRAPARRTAPRFPLPFPREGTSSDTFILAEACAKLKDLDDEPATTARKALDFIRNAGVGGLSFNALAVGPVSISISRNRTDTP